MKKSDSQNPSYTLKGCIWWVANYTLLRPIDANVAETQSLVWIHGKKTALNINVSTVPQYKLYICDPQPDCYIADVQKYSAIKLYRRAQLYVLFKGK